MAQTLRKRVPKTPSAPELKAAFAARLNELCDAAGIPEKGRGRQEALRAEIKDFIKISQKGVRKWLEGESFPELERVVQLAIHFDVRIEWLLSGRGDVGVKNSVSARHAKLIDSYEKADPKMRLIVDSALGL